MYEYTEKLNGNQYEALIARITLEFEKKNINSFDVIKNESLNEIKISIRGFNKDLLEKSAYKIFGNCIKENLIEK